jgi:hypothetical protein
MTETESANIFLNSKREENLIQDQAIHPSKIIRAIKGKC